MCVSYNESEFERNQTGNMYLEELADRFVSVDSSDTETQYSNVYYDAVCNWVLALALNRSIPMLGSLSYDLSTIHMECLISFNIHTCTSGLKLF